MRMIVACLMALVIAGCSSGGVVVFEPTPRPPDLSPLAYTHPGGAFTVSVPRTWAVYTQHTTALASASFSPPGTINPPLSVTVAHLQNPVDLLEFVNRYQVELRPDIRRYTEQGRQQMDDGSWRLSGIRENAAGVPQEVNTFIVQEGAFVGVIDVQISDEATRTALETVINTLSINTGADLEPAGASILAAATVTDLEFADVQAWWTAGGVFFITGEVFNHSGQTLSEIPVRARLFDGTGTGVAEAFDTVMGYALPPGEFAPFSLRFDNPQGASDYTLELGAPQVFDGELTTNDDLDWTFEPSRSPEDHLIIQGEVTNTGSTSVERPVVTITVFDAARNVIAAGFTVVTEDDLAPQDSQSYVLRVPEMGGVPQDYFVNVQARR